ncbi:MAG TPA: metal-dependent hydrolase [Pyrinomonadaceae bacterium]
MPLPIAHGLLGASLVAAVLPRASARRYALSLAAGALLANAADLDFLLVFGLHMRGWHRAFTHSFAFALLVWLLLFILLGGRRARKSVAYGLAYASHAVLDFATTKFGGGVELLWPFTSERFALGLFGLSEIPSRVPPAGIVRYIVLELLIFTPPFLALLLWRRRGRKAVDSSQ